jgi:methylmalonyl-CoA mutase
MSEPLLGEPADEADWRALVEQGLKGARWERLVGQAGDGIAIQPLYREPDLHTAADVSGFPGAAPYIRGERVGAWRIRTAFEHPDIDQTNREILADLAGGVASIELVIGGGVGIRSAGDLDRVLADVILEAAPVSLDRADLAAATMLEAKLKGVAAPGTAFNLDPIGAFMRSGEFSQSDFTDATGFAERMRGALPAATALRVDARPVHEAGGTEAQEIAAALCAGIAYLRALTGDDGLSADEAGSALSFAVAIGPDVLVETAKLRALRLCWARVTEASGAAAEHQAARLHAFTSRRMMARHDAWTNILRVTTAAFAAGIGGADDITTYPFTDALGLPTPFARRVARNTQHVLLEECRLGHVADPAGGAWFVEKLTRDLAAKAWEIMQEIERRGGIVAALRDGYVQGIVGEARTRRQQQIATRRETITGVTDFPLLGAAAPEVNGVRVTAMPSSTSALAPIRWAEPFEALRDRAETPATRPAAFFANIAALAEFGPRAQWTRNLFASGGVGAIGDEDAHASMEALIDAFRASKARVAVIASTDARYAEHAENCAQRLKAAGADWVIMAGKPGESEAKYRAAGVDQFVFAGQDAIETLKTVHAAFGLD